jgi:cytochrome c-type biogenesis protein
MRHGTDQAPFYWVLALFVAGLSLAGYAGYFIYPRFDLPAAAGIGLLVLSIGAGVASFFSPCSFPLLVTLLARQAGSQRESAGQEASSSLPFAAALAAGASMFFLIAGIIVAFGGGALLEGVTFTSAAGRIIRVAVGGLLVVLGLFQLNLLSTPSFHTVSRLAEPLSKFQARQCRQRPVFGFAVFGLGYPLAGFG